MHYFLIMLQGICFQNRDQKELKIIFTRQHCYWSLIHSSKCLNKNSFFAKDFGCDKIWGAFSHHLVLDPWSTLLLPIFLLWSLDSSREARSANHEITTHLSIALLILPCEHTKSLFQHIYYIYSIDIMWCMHACIFAASWLGRPFQQYELLECQKKTRLRTHWIDCAI